MNGKLLLSLLLLLLMNIINKAQGASIKFDEEEYDFGRIKLSTKVSHVFYFTNSGKKPLRLIKVTSSCGCTTPKWDSLPVNPGKRGSITVLFECFPLEKVFTKTITVESNAEHKTNFLDIKGSCYDTYKSQKEKFTFPIGRLLFETNHTDFDKIYSNVIRSQNLVNYFNNSDDTITIYGFQTPEYIECASSPNVMLPHQEGTIIINYNASLKKTLGFKLDKIKMQTSDRDVPDKILVVSADVLEYFDVTVQNDAHIYLKETSFEFGKIKIGDIKTHVFEIKNTGTDTLFIRNIRPSCGCTEFELSNYKILPGKTAQLKIIYNTLGATKGVNNKPITIISSDRSNQVTNIGVSVIVD